MGCPIQTQKKINSGFLYFHILSVTASMKRFKVDNLVEE
jgi:hypothetical protein